MSYRSKKTVVLSTIVYCTILLLTTTTNIEQVVGFAANPKKGGGGGRKNNRRKKKKGGGASSSTIKGFGTTTPLPQFNDIVASFPTRIPKQDANNHKCPCGRRQQQSDDGKSPSSYGDCCGPLHRGELPCWTMTDVLCSRYTAFAWRIIPHIMDTTHPTCRDYRKDRLAWAKDLNNGGMFDSFEFTKLEIVGEEEFNDNDENEGFMDFKVTLVAKEDNTQLGTLAGQETVIKERSRFLRDKKDKTWSYASGDVRSDVAGLEDMSLNV